LLAAYHAASIERGFSFFGLRYIPAGQLSIGLASLITSAPGLAMLPFAVKQIRAGNWRQGIYLLFFPMLAVITVYGIVTSNELKDSDFAKMLIADYLVFFGPGMPRVPAWSRRCYMSLVCALMVSDICATVARTRVLFTGNHIFFEWNDANRAVRDKNGFFTDMHAAPEVNRVIGEVSQVVNGNAGTVFLGPLMEWEYALNRLTPPKNWPVYWEAGTSFARRDTGSLIARWENQHYQTLIFLRGEYSFSLYPDELVNDIKTNYEEDDSNPDIVVFRLRGPR
jgi:hypothetical protein